MVVGMVSWVWLWAWSVMCGCGHGQLCVVVGKVIKCWPFSEEFPGVSYIYTHTHTHTYTHTHTHTHIQRGSACVCMVVSRDVSYIHMHTPGDGERVHVYVWWFPGMFPIYTCTLPEMGRGCMCMYGGFQGCFLYTHAHSRRWGEGACVCMVVSRDVSYIHMHTPGDGEKVHVYVWWFPGMFPIYTCTLPEMGRGCMCMYGGFQGCFLYTHAHSRRWGEGACVCMVVSRDVSYIHMYTPGDGERVHVYVWWFPGMFPIYTYTLPEMGRGCMYGGFQGCFLYTHVHSRRWGEGACVCMVVSRDVSYIHIHTPGDGERVHVWWFPGMFPIYTCTLPEMGRGCMCMYGSFQGCFLYTHAHSRRWGEGACVCMVVSRDVSYIHMHTPGDGESLYVW